MRKFNRLVVAVSLAVGFASLIACNAPVHPTGQAPVSVMDYRMPANQNASTTSAATVPNQSPISILDQAGYYSGEYVHIGTDNAQIDSIDGTLLYLNEIYPLQNSYPSGTPVLHCEYMWTSCEG